MSEPDLKSAGRLRPAGASWRSILVQALPGKPGRIRLESASALAADLDALLIGIGAETVEPFVYADPYMTATGEMFETLRAEITAHLAAAEADFKAAAAQVRHEWRAYAERPGPVLAALSREADLIVAGGEQELREDGYRKASAAELALTSGRPVLVVPPQGGRLRAEAVLVAWKDGREARRAVADALPLLKCAGAVRVLAVAPKDSEAEVEAQVADVVAGLKRHEVPANGHVIAAPDSAVAELLDQEASAFGADLLVAGCYGHSRANEWLFGGVTQDLLSRTDRFVLFSH